MGFLGVCFEVGKGGQNYSPPLLKLVRITLQTSNLARKYTHIYSFRKFTFYYLDPVNLADVIIFCKNQRFLAKIVPLLKDNSVRVVFEIF